MHGEPGTFYLGHQTAVALPARAAARAAVLAARWEHRASICSGRHRRKGRDFVEHDLASGPAPPLSKWLDWLLHAGKYTATTKAAVSYWVAICFLVGSTFFVIGAGGGLNIHPSSDLYELALVDAAYIIGGIFFIVGCSLLVPEAINADLEKQQCIWNKQNNPNPAFKGDLIDVTVDEVVTEIVTEIVKSHRSVSINAEKDLDGHSPSIKDPLLITQDYPSYKWFGMPAKQSGHWHAFMGACIYLVGAWCYEVATLSVYLSYAALPPYSLDVCSKIAEVGYFVGGLCFFVGAYMYVLEETNCWYKGIIPLSKDDLYDVGFWINFLNFWGSCGFLCSGAFGLFDRSMTVWTERAELGVGYLGGSLFFLVASYLMLFELTNPVVVTVTSNIKCELEDDVRDLVNC